MVRFACRPLMKIEDFNIAMAVLCRMPRLQRMLLGGGGGAICLDSEAESRSCATASGCGWDFASISSSRSARGVQPLQGAGRKTLRAGVRVS